MEPCRDRDRRHVDRQPRPVMVPVGSDRGHGNTGGGRWHGLLRGLEGQVHAVEANSGHPLWTTPLQGGAVVGSPSIDGKRVFVGVGKTLYVLDRSTGRILGKRSPTPIRTRKSMHRRWCSATSSFKGPPSSRRSSGRCRSASEAPSGLSTCRPANWSGTSTRRPTTPRVGQVKVSGPRLQSIPSSGSSTSARTEPGHTEWAAGGLAPGHPLQDGHSGLVTPVQPP